MPRFQNACRTARLLLVLCLGPLSFTAAPAGAGIDPYENCWGEIAYTGPGTPAVCHFPDGGGNPLTDARLENGGAADATISVHVVDLMYDPVAAFPAEDLWLVSADEGLVCCPSGSIADGPTDQNGVAVWTAPLRAGGWSQSLTLILINGIPLVTGAGLPLYHNSPDLNGDLVVNLADVSIFSIDYATYYRFRSDLHRDGVINIADLGVFVRALGATCP